MSDSSKDQIVARTLHIEESLIIAPSVGVSPIERASPHIRVRPIEGLVPQKGEDHYTRSVERSWTRSGEDHSTRSAKGSRTPLGEDYYTCSNERNWTRSGEDPLAQSREVGMDLIKFLVLRCTRAAISVEGAWGSFPRALVMLLAVRELSFLATLEIHEIPCYFCI
ncbi:hypothetical protein CRG98_019078 [Punica granatum]|uniref:Uncharacterized protein n=1 Tax=Punica granatum TaxID=22663 RepID=A0A2I0JWH0_PUNGR|nr:hypothetical protein CRG98_019078 [Punica granatum]